MWLFTKLVYFLLLLQLPIPTLGQFVYSMNRKSQLSIGYKL
jgi:ABC-type spermidine/putrescine transport system permease subunit II